MVESTVATPETGIQIMENGKGVDGAVNTPKRRIMVDSAVRTPENGAWIMENRKEVGSIDNGSLLEKRIWNTGNEKRVGSTVHCGPEQPRIQTALLGHSLVRSLVRSHRSLVRLLQTARFARALRCAHSLAHFAHSLARGKVNF